MSVLVILLVGQAMASMDQEILVVAAPSLHKDLQASAADLQLVLAMYTIMFAALVVTGARLGDVIGRRRAFLLGLTGFTFSSLAGGLAASPEALIVARCAQGASAAAPRGSLGRRVCRAGGCQGRLAEPNSRAAVQPSA